MYPSPTTTNRRSGKGAIAGLALGLGALVLLLPTAASGNANSASSAGTKTATVPFVATLTGAAEVPGPGSTTGSGAVALTIDVTTGEICADLRVAGLSTATPPAAPTGFHIHKGAAGVSSPVLVPLTAPTAATPTTSSACVIASPISVAADIVATPADYYVNVHTTEFPNGAIRGQLAKSSATTGTIQLLPSPLRAYDSRVGTDGPLAKDTTRVVSLGTGIDGSGVRVLALPPGATAAMVRLTATQTVSNGFLKLYSNALTKEPLSSSLNWNGTDTSIGTDTTVSVDAEGKVKVTAKDSSTGFVIDVTGYIY